MHRLLKHLERIPYHPLVFATYPILALLAHNIREADALQALRPLLISMGGTLILFLLTAGLFRNWRRAAITTSFLLLLFFSYGHVYTLIEGVSILGMNIGRHRFFIPFFGGGLAIGIWWTLKKLQNVSQVTQTLNIMGLLLLIIPSAQIINYSARLSAGNQASTKLIAEFTPLNPPDSNNLPDIYYIILDTYTRGDALLEDFNFDNSQFLYELREMGFFVADCSRSNYGFTTNSLTSSLNYHYLPELEKIIQDSRLGSDDYRILLKQSLVRYQLEAIGYKMVAIDSGVKWSRLTDANIYLSLSREAFELQALDPFEAMVINSTAGLILTDELARSHTGQISAITNRIDDINFPHKGYAELQWFIIDQLKEIASTEGPKFVFAHLLIPHVPYIFDPEGKIRDDPGFYSGEGTGAINDKYLRRGYIGEIQFINGQMIQIVKEVLETSRNEPIIIIQGDHGLKGGNRFMILNTYYLPGESDEKLYPHISPINSFRVIFNEHFGTQFELLPDISYAAADHSKVDLETSTICIR